MWQNILPWSFSLLQFTREIKGTPELETKIVTEVAGYGSQLGTIMDVIEVMQKEYPIDVKTLDEEEAYMYLKFKEPVKDIGKLKA